MGSLGCFVTIYNPSTDVIANIKSYPSFFKVVWIFDNTERPNESFRDKLVEEIRNVVYVGDNINEGIAKRLNQSIVFARQENIGWLLMMDQDSSFTKSNIITYCKFINTLSDATIMKTIMVGVSTEIDFVNTEIQIQKTKVNTLITSGTFLNLQLTNLVGEFNENLFIYEVDYEYCFRASKAGFDLLKLSNLHMIHRFGEAHLTRSFRSILFKKRDRSLSSPTSLYYHVRNYLWLRENYKSFIPSHFKKYDIGMLLHIKNNLFYNPKRFGVLKCIIRAIRDYRNDEMGKLC